MGRNWRHGALKGAALVWPRCCTWGAGGATLSVWDGGEGLRAGGSRARGSRSSFQPARCFGGCFFYPFLLSWACSEGCGVAARSAQCGMQFGLWAEEQEGFQPTSFPCRLSEREDAAKLPKQRLRGAHLHGHALMALPGCGCSALCLESAWPGTQAAPAAHYGTALHSA